MCSCLTRRHIRLILGVPRLVVEGCGEAYAWSMQVKRNVVERRCWEWWAEGNLEERTARYTVGRTASVWLHRFTMMIRPQHGELINHFSTLIKAEERPFLPVSHRADCWGGPPQSPVV